MTKGITVRILGDFGPFSRMGKSIGYQIRIGRAVYLLDCGAPLFQQIGGEGLKETKGLIITHCHDDHKRWFTDLALFNMYIPDVLNRVFLLTSEDVQNELLRASAPALDRSLSEDSKRVVDIPYEEYVNHRRIGPEARYRIASVEEGGGRTSLCVMDSDGKVVGPERAKVVISRKTGRARMLFKDPDYGEWVEPECFYPYCSDTFYKQDGDVYVDEEEGFTVEALKAPVWHGIPAIGIRIRTGGETLIFSSDTVNDLELWRALYSEKRQQRLGMTVEEFEAASVIYGDINDYIERVWSEERYREAVEIMSDEEAVVIHDVTTRATAVHTDYRILKDSLLDRERAILTHSPDRLVSEWPLCDTEKTFRIEGRRFFEVVDGELYPMDADIYLKDTGRYYVGYRNDNGRYRVYERDGLLSISAEEGGDRGTLLYRIDLYEDIGGRYFPKLERDDAMYLKRRDGRVELIEFTEEGSRGRIVENQRGRILKAGASGGRDRVSGISR